MSFIDFALQGEKGRADIAIEQEQGGADAATEHGAHDPKAAQGPSQAKAVSTPESEACAKKKAAKSAAKAKKQKGTKRCQVRNKGVDFTKVYSASEALELVKARANAKFDETMEVVFACNLDTKKGDQALRAMISLPAGIGKPQRVAVFATGDQAAKAKAAGADIVGGVELIEKVQGGFMEFDVCIADPEMMPQLAKLGRVLGPRSLMPNPKLGTVTTDLVTAIDRAKKGQVSLRADKQGIVHSILGKVSFKPESLLENFRALSAALLALKPEGVKGDLIKGIYISSTMGFALKVSLSELSA